MQSIVMAIAQSKIIFAAHCRRRLFGSVRDQPATSGAHAPNERLHLDEIIFKMQRMTKPPPPHDFYFFVSIRLESQGKNPHRFVLSREVLRSEVEGFLEKLLARAYTYMLIVTIWRSVEEWSFYGCASIGRMKYYN